MHVVCVTFDIHPGKMAEFLPLMHAQAHNSLTREPGCHRFDVCTADNGRAVFLYELYTDKDAFQEHLASAHFKAFDAATADLIAAKTVQTYTLAG